jgi:hypothetical protein
VSWWSLPLEPSAPAGARRWSTGTSVRTTSSSRPTWADLVSLWPRMARHGIDVRAHRSAPVLQGARDDDIDAFLAALAGFLLADATLRLVSERRGWSMLRR